MAPASLTSALSSMEVMLDALMQRGIGKPEEPSKPKEEEEPPALPSRPTGRGRLPGQRAGGAASAPWIRPSTPEPQPTQQEDEEKCSVNAELERRAAKAEEDVKAKEEEMRQREEEMRQKEELIATLQRQVEHYESRLSECEVRMKSVEEELQRQITSLQMAQAAAGATRDGSSTKHSQQESSSRGGLPPSHQPSSARLQQCGSDHCTIAVAVAAAADESTLEAVNQMARELQTDREQEAACEHGACAVPVVGVVGTTPPPPLLPPSSAKSVEELRTLKRQFASWKKEYEAKLKKARAELKRLSHHAEKKGNSGGDGHGHQRRCGGWWRIKAPKCCRAPKCCSFKLPSAKSCCCCCFRR